MCVRVFVCLVLRASFTSPNPSTNFSLKRTASRGQGKPRRGKTKGMFVETVVEDFLVFLLAPSPLAPHAPRWRAETMWLTTSNRRKSTSTNTLQYYGGGDWD